MSILLSRRPSFRHGFVVVGLVGLSSPRVVLNGVLFLGIVVSAGARFWHVRSVPAAIQRRTRAALDVRKMVPSDLGNRSPGQASRGLGLRDGLRGRARGRPPM